MFGLSATIRDETYRVRRAAKEASRGVLRFAAYSIRQTAVASIDRADGPSQPGSPPHTHRGNWLRRAIFYAAEVGYAIIGSRSSYVGEAGAAHEQGGMFRGQDFDKRPFMEPALMQNVDLFAGSWSGSIEE